MTDDQRAEFEKRRDDPLGKAKSLRAILTDVEVLWMNDRGLAPAEIERQLLKEI